VGLSKLVLTTYISSGGRYFVERLVFLQISYTSDVEKIIHKYWFIDSSPMLLKNWRPLFDAERERVDVLPIWVWLPGFPLEFWNENSFKVLGNLLGTYLDVDWSYKETCAHSMAQILVSINLRRGLDTNLEIVAGNRSFIQKLDYEGVSFLCHRCHLLGNLANKCSAPL
jgi:hypothetical protein